MNIKFLSIGIVAALSFGSAGYTAYSAFAPKVQASQPAAEIKSSVPVDCDAQSEVLLELSVQYSETADMFISAYQSGDRFIAESSGRLVDQFGKSVVGQMGYVTENCGTEVSTRIRLAKGVVEQANYKISAATATR
jgi:hypothetical protein